MGLCHGISGNAYAFLSLYRATKDELYLHRAQQLGRFMIPHRKELQHDSDAPLSLFEVRTNSLAAL